VTVRSLAVVSAGLSQPSSSRLLADRLAAAVGAVLPVETTLIEVRDHSHDVVNNLLTGFPSPALAGTLSAVSAADGLIAVSPIFNASYSGLFKSFFDVLGDAALVDKPVLIAATGGTMRHSLALEHALRPMFVYLRGVVMPTSVFAAAEDWAGDDAEGPLRERIRRAARELAEQVEKREPAAPADPFALTTSFEDLLSN